MGIVGKYIDALSDVQRDRVIEAKEIRPGGFFHYDGDGVSIVGCLVSVAQCENFSMKSRVKMFTVSHDCVCSLSKLGAGFDTICHRFGKDRIIRLCKARAAKPYQIINVEVDIHDLELEGALQNDVKLSRGEAHTQ